MDENLKYVPMAQTTAIHHLGWFLSSPHVVEAGIVAKAPLSHVSSEGGDKGMVGRGREETPSDSCFEREGC